MASWSAHADVREHCPELLDLGRGPRIVGILIQTFQHGERWHGGREPQHRGGQAVSFYMEVPQPRQRLSCCRPCSV